MHRSRILVSGILAASVAMACGDVHAQGSAKTEAAPAVAAAPVKPVEAPFMKPLSRLANILGSVHFLRGLCGDEQAGLWRERMNDLLTAQSPAAPDREALVASFNNGYRAFASVYRRCTPAARLAASRYQKEGADLSRDIAARYGN
ncbi:TIGR02301 family protein [Aureimonas psammosilenae]|uniref:TIGR02301 family protein n=1 Tax=Aureimonas psammosilenae TaxID=2495496 RepID=UPI00186A010D|nr:TIGR02301 family protein [Aureimonas psammosilenae]